MPKRIVKGVGMMKYAVSVYGPGPMGEAEYESFKEAMRRFAEAPVGDERREAIAQNCRELLARAGLADVTITSYAIDEEKLRSTGLAEDSAQWLSACWLRTFYRLKEEVTRINAGRGDVSLLISIAEELGRIQAHTFWRAGVDPQTGKRREILAMSGRRQVKGGRDGNAMRTDTSFAALYGAAAQARADALHRENPRRTWGRIRQIIASEYKVSPETVKKALRNPKKPG